MGTFIEINGCIMGNHPYVLFAVVEQLPTCKQCYYTTTELLKVKNFKSFTVAKLDFEIHRLSNGRLTCKLKSTEMQPFMQYEQINIESSNLSQQTEYDLLSLIIFFTVAISSSWYPCQSVGFDCGFRCLKGVVVLVGLNPTKYTGNVVHCMVCPNVRCFDS